MALPSSGQISINDIRVELGASATNQSLRAFSNTAGFTTPDAISEFYGYSNLTSFSYNSSGQEEGSACSLEDTPDTAYHNGSGTYPDVDDLVYSNSTGTTSLSDATYKIDNGSLFGADMVVDSGEVVSITNCRS